MNTNINQQMITNIIDDIEFITDDDDDEKITNTQYIKNIASNELLYETISDDDDETRPDIQAAKNNTGNDLLYETISDDDDQESNMILQVNNANAVNQDKDHEQQQLPMKRQSCHRRRTAEARKRRNRKRNNTFRLRRYHCFMTRRIYHRLTMKSIKSILHQYNIRYTHIKIVAESLVIGVKNDIIKQQNERKLPDDIFDRDHY